MKAGELPKSHSIKNPYQGKLKDIKPPTNPASSAPNAPAAPAQAAPTTPSADAYKVELSEQAKTESTTSDSKSLKEKLKLPDVFKKPSTPTPPLPKVPEIKKDAKVKAEKAGKAEDKTPRFGFIKKPAIIFIPGLDMFSSGTVANSSNSYDGVRKMAESVPGARLYGWDQHDEIIDHIKKLKEDQPVVLVGHSYGGDTAHEVAEELNTLENGFRKVDLMVTIDSIGVGNDVVPQNVKRNLNIFSDKDWLINDGPHVARNHHKTKVYNILRDEKHTDLDDSNDVQREVLEAINTVVGKMTSKLEEVIKGKDKDNDKSLEENSLVEHEKSIAPSAELEEKEDI